MKKKILSMLLCVTMIAGLLAGCGSDNTTAESSTETSASTSTTEEAAPAESTGDKLVYWSMWDAAEPQAQAIAQSIEAFTAETGIEVDVQFKGRTGIREGLQPALDAGTNIDLFDEDIDRVNVTWAAICLIWKIWLLLMIMNQLQMQDSWLHAARLLAEP